MVKKADNNELNNYFSEEEIGNLGEGKDNNQQQGQNNKPNQNKNKQNHNKNNRRKNNNHNQNKQNHNKNNNQQQSKKKSSIPTNNKSEATIPEPMNDYKPEEFVDYDNLNKPKQEEAPYIPTFGEYQEQKANESKNQAELDKTLHEYEEAGKERDDILKNISFDLNNIDIISDTEFDIVAENTNFVLNNKATYQTPLSQSSYIAHVESLKSAEIISLIESVGDDYNSTLKKYQLYFSKINTNSLGIDNFNDFARYTSLYDIETLEYGIYNMSFPGETKFNINCNKCGETTKDVPVPNDNLVKFKDEEVYEHINKNINNLHKFEDVKKYSLIYKTKRIVLGQSKIVVDLVIPTVERHLKVLSEVHMEGLTEEEKQKFLTYQQVLFHIDNLYIPDLKSIKEGKNKFHKVEGRDIKKLIKLLQQLNLRDSHQLSTKIVEIVDENAIEFAIQGLKCPKCKEDMGDIEVEMDKLLFQEALQLD